MSFALSLPAKLLLPLAAFGGIGVAVLPADFRAAPDLKTLSSPAATLKPSFNVAPLPAEALNKAPTISSPPAPVAVSAPVAASTAAWPPAWTTRVATATPAEPANLTVDHVNGAVNVRAAGQKGAPVLFVLPAGAEVRVADTAGGWVHIFADQGEGWVYSSFIGTPRATPVQASLPVGGRAVRLSGAVTVRDMPAGTPLYQLDPGERIRILETDGNWARIATSSGEGGWVRMRS
jgi:SH3-like domain-containing protein